MSGPPSTTDPRALQNAGASGRVAAAWYSGRSFTLNVNVSGGAAHQMALYFLDWEAAGRTETVNIYDVASGTLLDNRTVSNFTNGQYLVWTINGNVNVQISSTAGPNAVLSGIFLARDRRVSHPHHRPSSPSSNRTPQRKQLAIELRRRRIQCAGRCEFFIRPTRPSRPAVRHCYVWAPATTDPRALQNAGASGRVAAAWYSTTSLR